VSLLQDIKPRPMVDGFGRRIEYVRLSVTDRCDLRCRYCMSEFMQFVPNADLLSFAELEQLTDAMIDRGVRRVRLTGGEPLVRRGIEQLILALGSRIGSGLDELTMTTNGTQLGRFAPQMYAAGIRRINVSLDTLDTDRFRHITRRGDLTQVLDGIAAAKAAGLAIKINTVALAGQNEDEIVRILEWCALQGFDLTLIETMPLGDVEGDRTDRFLPLDVVKRRLEERFAFMPSMHRTGGPARYYQVEGTGIRLGLISPLTRNFCSGCNRVRVTATGTVYGCLGHDQHVDLRGALRTGGRAELDALLDEVIAGKPLGHDFNLSRPAPAVARHMSVTGG
jgi:GTP 3',8-cyclase